MTAAETVAAIRAALEEAGREYRARVDDILDAVLAELSPPRAEAHTAPLVVSTAAEAERDEARAELAGARRLYREASLTIRSLEGLRKERDGALAEVARQSKALDDLLRDRPIPGSEHLTWAAKLVLREPLPIRPDRETVIAMLSEHAPVLGDPDVVAKCSCGVAGLVSYLSEARAWHQRHLADAVLALFEEAPRG